MPQSCPNFTWSCSCRNKKYASICTHERGRHLVGAHGSCPQNVVTLQLLRFSVVRWHNPQRNEFIFYRKATSDVVWVRGQYSTYIIYSAGFSHRFEIAKLDRFKDMLDLLTTHHQQFLFVPKMFESEILN